MGAPAAASHASCLSHLSMASASPVPGPSSCGLCSSSLSGSEPGCGSFCCKVRGGEEGAVCTMSPKDAFRRISGDTGDWGPRSEIAESQGGSISNVLSEKTPCYFPGGCIKGGPSVPFTPCPHRHSPVFLTTAFVLGVRRQLPVSTCLSLTVSDLRAPLPVPVGLSIV